VSRAASEHLEKKHMVNTYDVRTVRVVATTSNKSDYPMKPEATRIIISAIVHVLPLNPFIHSIVSLDNKEKSIRYGESALRTDHRLAGFIHC
jgi:hypothetical protein